MAVIHARDAKLMVLDDEEGLEYLPAQRDGQISGAVRWEEDGGLEELLRGPLPRPEGATIIEVEIPKPHPPWSGWMRRRKRHPRPPGHVEPRRHRAQCKRYRLGPVRVEVRT